jgi:hypothetical protein
MKESTYIQYFVDFFGLTLVLKNNVFRGIIPAIKSLLVASYWFLFLHGVLFDLEDGSDTFL